MAQPLYVNGAICTYATATGTIAPTTGLQLDGAAQSSALPQTVIVTPSVSGLYLITVYMRLTHPASGVAPTSTFGPMTVYFTCADCLLPISVIALLSIQDGTVQAGISNSDNSIGSSLIGSTVINALAGQPISVAIGYASSGATPTCTATCTLTSAAWNVAAIEVRGTPVYVGGNGVAQAGGATTQTVTYSPTAGNSTVLYFETGSAITNLVVKDNLSHTLSAGPTSGTLSSFYQYPVPAGVTSYTATWTTARQSSFVVEEYSGVTSINASLAGNTASGSSGTATLTVTDNESTDITVFGFGSGNILTATVGNQRHQVNGSTARLTTVDSTAAGAMAFSYHVKSVFLGGLPS